MAKIRLSHTMEKNICYRQRRRKEVVSDDCVLEDSLFQGDWHIEEDPNVDYEMLLRGLRACAGCASKPRTTNLDRISVTIEELLERRRALRFDPNALHIERTLDEAQPQEQAGFRQGFSCLDQTVSRVIEVCREYRMPLVLTFVDYEKAFDRVETNAILSALVVQGVDASYVRTLANCYERCTTRIQLFHHLIIPIGKGVRQGDTKSPKLFMAALQWIMKSLSWEERSIRVDGRFLSNLRFADDIVLFSSSTNEAETMLNELNEAGKRIALRINKKKTQFMKNAYCEDGGVQLEGSQIVETPSYVYLGRSMNMENDLKEELNRRMRAAWAAFAAVREATDQLTDQDLRAHLFDSTVLSSLCYAAKTWADTTTTSRKLLSTHRALKRCLLKFNRRTQHLAGLRSSDLRGISRLRDPAEYVLKAKHRWAGHIMRRIDDRWTKRTLEWIPRDAKRPRRRPPTR
ncbi:hypothetical protein RB195_002036 [Necator americanus]|uniref:Reverse transcriptase domain-containing protein n=1 Tax=Necator americanus TaxID=51031 RepID=A0ABR1DH30_NECAM